MERYNTDKYEHGFIDVYEPYFNNSKNVKNVLEIGVYFGGSLQYLSDKFPEAKIYGIDIENKTQYDTDIDRFMMHKGHEISFVYKRRFDNFGVDMISS